MKLPIKFRGKTHDGKIFHGDLIHRFGMVAIGEYGDFQEVEPDSVARLVGYDADGREVYEGDVVVDDFGDEIAVGFLEIYGAGYQLGGEFRYWKLKEAEQNGKDI